MDTEEFVRSFRSEKDQLLRTFMADPPDSAVALHIQKMGLGDEQRVHLGKALDQALTDAFYTILLGLDGCCRIGNAKQQSFKIQSEEGFDISGNGGEIEALAYQYFQEKP